MEIKELLLALCAEVEALEEIDLYLNTDRAKRIEDLITKAREITKSKGKGE